MNYTEETHDFEVFNRLGIRLLYLHILGTEKKMKRQVIWPSKRCMGALINILQKRCADTDMVKIDFIDAELLQLVSLMIEEGTGMSMIMNADYNPLSLDTLSASIMRRFCNSSKCTKKTNGDGDDQRKGLYMRDFINKLLDEQHSQECGAMDLFRDAMIHFLFAHSSLVQTQVKSPSPLSMAFIENSMNLLHGNLNIDCKLSDMSRQTHSLLHYALLTYILREISVPTSVLVGALKTQVNSNLIQSIVKTLIAGITNSDCATEKIDATDMEPMVRALSLKSIASLFQNIGIAWMKKGDKKDSLGEASTFCVLVRLAAGELRIVLGQLVDLSLKMRDPDSNGMAPTEEREWLASGEVCIQIGIYALETMLDLSSDDGKIDAFGADSILHVRHSLDDYLDACVQFLSDDLSDGSFFQWINCAYSCCRFLGAYLVQINIFDYDIGIEDEAKDEVSNQHRMNSITLLGALRNALILCCKYEDVEISSSVEVLTLLPCVVATLTCCESSKHISTVQTYLLSGGILPEAIELVLKKATVRAESKEKDDLYLCLKNLSWCSMLIDSLLDCSKISVRILSNFSMNEIANSMCSGSISLYKTVQKQSFSNEDRHDVRSTLGQVIETLNGVVYTQNGKEAIFNLMELKSCLEEQIAVQ